MNVQNTPLPKKSKRSDWLSILAIVLTFAIGGGINGLNGQDDSASDDAIELEALAVDGGIAFSRKRSIEVKRVSDNFVDAISAEGLGRFPDENVAESLQRIAGVQINRERGEGRTVNIRGLPSNFTQVFFNGRTLSSALGPAGATVSRSFDFQALPSQFISTLKVHKTPTADMEEGGLSGVVDVETASAFDFGKRVVALSAQTAWESNSGKYSPRASLLFSDIFADGKVGLALGLAYTERRPETHQAGGGFLRRNEVQGLQSSPSIDWNGNGELESDYYVRVLGSQTLHNYKETRERNSAIAKLEYRPNDDLDLFLETFYSEVIVASSRYENLHRFQNAEGLDPNGNTGIITRSDVHGTHDYLNPIDAIRVDLRGGSRFEDRSGDLTSISAGGELRRGDWTISAEVATTDSTQSGNDLNVAPIARVSLSADLLAHPDVSALRYEDGFEQERFNPEIFQFASLNGPFQRDLSDELFDARLDFEKQVGWNSINTLKFGFKHSDRAQDKSNGRLVINGARMNALIGLPEGPGGPGSFSAAQFMQLVEPGNGRFLDSFGGHSIFPNEALHTDTRGFLANYTEEELAAAGVVTNAVTGIIDVEEQVFASYGMIEFGSSDGAISGNFGVRFVDTDQTSRGNEPDITKITVQPEAGNVTTIPAGEAVTVDRSYSEFLPSANLKMEVSDDVTLRFAASRTMARPDLGQITPIATANGNSAVITRQNPYLDPFLSNNFDVSTSWFVGEEGLFSVNLFYKDIVSLITQDSSQQDLPVTFLLDSTGETFVEDKEFTVNQPINGTGVNVKGYELSYQRPLNFLPVEGFGMLANYTFIDNSDPTVLTAASRHNYNLSGYYEKGKWGVRLSYTWRDQFLTSPGNANADGVMRDEFGILDGNITYNLTENVSLVLEAINLTDEARIQHTLTGLPSQYQDSGRRILFGARARF